MTDFITDTDLASYPGVTMPTDAAVSDLVLEITNGLVTDVVGDTVTVDDAPTRVRAIALEVAARSLRNPEGAESVTKGVDDWKKTIRYARADLTMRAGVYLTDEEKAELRGLVGRGKRRAGSIRLRVPDHGFGC